MKVPWLVSDITMRSYEQKILNWETIKEMAEESPIVASAVDLVERQAVSRDQALMVAVIKLALKNDELIQMLEAQTSNYVAPSYAGDPLATNVVELFPQR